VWGVTVYGLGFIFTTACFEGFPVYIIPAEFGHTSDFLFEGVSQIDFCPIRLHIGVPDASIPPNSSDFRDESNGTSPGVRNPDFPKTKLIFLEKRNHINIKDINLLSVAIKVDSAPGAPSADGNIHPQKVQVVDKTSG